MALPFTAHMGCLHSLSGAYLCRYSMFLTSPTSKGIHYSLGFAFTASYIALSGVPCKDSGTATHYQDSRLSFEI
jgi:hypothetical protein